MLSRNMSSLDELDYMDDDLDEPETHEDQDNIDPDLGDLAFDEDSSDDEVPPDPVASNSAPRTTSIANVQSREQRLRDEFKDLDVDDDKEAEEMHEMMKDRRALSERLEKDPEFREKYIESENERREREEAERIIREIQDDARELEELDELEDEDALRDLEETDIMRELEDLDDLHDSARTIIKPGVYIEHLENLTVNLTIS